jgi:DNA-binding NarL/FixJ family response regulator
MPDPDHRPRVVIAEDSVLLQESIRQTIGSFCDVVATAEEGEAACRAVATHAPDVLLLDVALPDMSGFAVAERLRGAPVAIIFITAYSEKAYADRAFQIGAKAYVAKGAVDVELPAALRAVLNGSLYRSSRIP